MVTVARSAVLSTEVDYPNRDSEGLWQMLVELRWTFPDFAAGGALVGRVDARARPVSLVPLVRLGTQYVVNLVIWNAPTKRS